MNGKLNGFGIQIYDNGNLYEGFWKDDIKVGKGKFTWKGGEVYIGDFENKVNGMGVIYFVKKGKYSGSWNEEKGTG